MPSTVLGDSQAFAHSVLSADQESGATVALLYSSGDKDVEKLSNLPSIT